MSGLDIIKGQVQLRCLEPLQQNKAPPHTTLPSPNHSPFCLLLLAYIKVLFSALFSQLCYSQVKPLPLPPHYKMHLRLECPFPILSVYGETEALSYKSFQKSTGVCVCVRVCVGSVRFL